MVVEAGLAEFPFIDGSAAAFGLDAVLGGQVLGQESVRVGITPKQRQATGITHRHSEPGLNERLPVVRIEHHMPHGALAGDIGNPPVVPDAVAAFAGVVAKRDAARANIAPVTRQQHIGVLALATELVHDIGRRAPVCIDEAAVDPQHRAVVASPFFGEHRFGEPF